MFHWAILRFHEFWPCLKDITTEWKVEKNMNEFDRQPSANIDDIFFKELVLMIILAKNDQNIIPK